MLLRPPKAASLSDPPKALESRYSAEFEAFWAIYPRKRDKAPAFKAHEAKLKHGAAPELLRTAAEHFAAFVEESGTEDDYIPYAATWLNEGKWLDFRDGVPRTPVKRGGNGRRPHANPMDEAEAKIAARHAQQQDTQRTWRALA